MGGPLINNIFSFSPCHRLYRYRHQKAYRMDEGYDKEYVQQIRGTLKILNISDDVQLGKRHKEVRAIFDEIIGKTSGQKHTWKYVVRPIQILPSHGETSDMDVLNYGKYGIFESGMKNTFFVAILEKHWKMLSGKTSVRGTAKPTVTRKESRRPGDFGDLGDDLWDATAVNEISAADLLQ